MSNDPFFEKPHSILEVAEYLGTTKVWVERQILLGRLRARKLSTRLVRILPEDLREWFERCATTPRKRAIAGDLPKEYGTAASAPAEAKEGAIS